MERSNLMNEISQKTTSYSNIKVNKAAFILLVGFILHILSLFSPLSNKAVNNVFYIGVMLPAILMTRWGDIKALFSSRLVVIAAIYAFVTSLMMAVTLDGYKIKYALYFLAFLLAFYHLTKNKLLNSAAVSYALCIFVLAYASIKLFIFYVVNGTPLAVRPWFSGWQLFTPSYFTAYISVASAAAAYYLIERKSHIIFFMLLSFVGALFVITQTRMGLVGIVASTPFFLWLAIKEKTIVVTPKTIFIFLVAMGVIFGLYLAGVFDVLMSRGSSYRLLIAKTAWAEGLNCNVVLGCGYGYDFALDIGYRVLITEHSSYSNQALRSGLLGVCLLLILIVSAVFSGCKTKTPWVLSFIAGCGCLMVEGQALMAQPRAFTQLIFWFPFCMIVMAELQYKGKFESKS